MRLLAALVVWGAAVAAALGVSAAVASGIHTTTASTAGAGAGPTSGGPTPGVTPSVPSAPTSAAPFDASSVKPTDRGSLFEGSNFRRVLLIAQHHLGSRADVEMTRIAPGAVQMTVLKGSRQDLIMIDIKGDYSSTDDGPLIGSAQVYYLSQLGAHVPATLAHRLATLAHQPISSINYMLVQTDPAAQEFFWRIYTTKQGVYFQAAGADSPIQELGGVRTLTFH
jgi:hypothetical protein